MISCFNKVNWVWQETDTPETLPNFPTNWVINPIFVPNQETCTQAGPNDWVYAIDGRTIRVMTVDEKNVDPRALTEAKEGKRLEINKLRQLKLASGFTDTNGISWDTTPVAISNLNAICTLITAGVVTANVTWRATNDVNHSLTPSQLIYLAATVAIFVRTQYEVSWAHKANISAATTVTAVLGYDFGVGW